jgi:GNAT superfamily N-acetyltransferase
VTGSAGDREVAAMLASAFADLAPSRYLVADREARVQALAGQFSILAEHARMAGGITSAAGTAGLEGAVVWFDHTTEPAPIHDYEDRLRAACGVHTDRFLAFDAAMEAHHPVEPHRYLALVGTRPGRQGRGIASGLLEQISADLDRDQTPAYLEAVSTRTAQLYARFGFEESADPFAIGPDGPFMQPMWRHPKPHRK